MATRVAIIYYSATGTTYQLARAVEQGASEGGAEVRFRKVRELAPDEAIASNQGWAAHRLESQQVQEASNDDLVWADAIIFGTPTRYGLPTALTRSARHLPVAPLSTAARKRQLSA